MELTNREEVAEFLQKAAVQNWNWVAFDRSKDDPSFYGYAAEAEGFCTAANNVFDYFEQNFVVADHVFLPVANLAASFEQKNLPLGDDLRNIGQQLKELHISLQPGWQMSDLKVYLQQEMFFPVQWQQVIEPEKEVKRFLVAEHTHPGHQMYEIGHEVGILKYFESQGEGRDFLLNKGKELSANKRQADLILAGEYRGRNLKLDMEGCPEEHCGITLLTLHCDRDGSVRLSTPNQLNDPVTIEQTLYARFDAKRGTVRLHDDRLKWTDPKLLPASTYASYFNKEVLTIKKGNIMNQESFNYNAETLKNLGFGEGLKEELHQKMDQNLAGFTLNHSRQFGKDVVDSVLHFSKGDDLAKDITFFNRFESTLKKEGMEDLTQTFFVGPKHNYTLQERYNMMDGRAVYREQPKMEPKEEKGTTRMRPTGETYFAWRSLNFKEADKYGNFNPKVIFWDHEKELQKYPIKNVQEKYDRNIIMRPLQKGNRVEVTLVRDGNETQAQVVANPRMMRLDFYDADGQNLSVRKVEKQAVSQTQAPEMTPQEVQKAAIARAAEQAQSNTPSQSQAASANEAMKQQNEADQKQNQGQRRGQKVHV
ncbi:hypothetical protein [Mucilaginibacter pedocola]|uniref:DUF3945 domain-containing protein n=1 Tax=Mucilaginibacter pedocola TaxID=1792845 RepID=A0A1S9PGD8_9SPHI|nr:hypothetical protein [Mucilaginibacter pedocola]OOQ60021.1 hypothetical protein BC343_27210 [Mucilaginibacter pedocola]